MRSLIAFLLKDVWFNLSILFLLVLGAVILNSLSASLFPLYFIYLFVALFIFWFFTQVGFDIVLLFSRHLYITSIVLLLLTLVIGSVTRGTIRWIPIGPLSLQPAELVRPFLLVFFAGLLTKGEVTFKRFLNALVLLGIPVFLILVQPSLGVSIMTVVGFFGVLLATNFNKKYLITGILMLIALMPLFWLVMAPYQKQRLMTFVDPENDPLGAGYNSLQSSIALGAGKFSGRGLGSGVQTQLSFLPEKQTDFVFAAIGEELGFVGVSLLLLASFTMLFRITKFMEKAVSIEARAYLSGFFLTLLVQIFVHAGMNMGLLPVTGLPFPLVSAGGSSLMATMMGLGIALGCIKGRSTKTSLGL